MGRVPARIGSLPGGFTFFVPRLAITESSTVAIEKEISMNGERFSAALLLGFFLATPLTALAQGKVQITSPADGATLDAMNENRLAYDVDPGPRGDHVHVYVDNKEVGILRKLKGSHLLESLDAGKRSLCVKVVNKAHVPIGLEKCIQVTVK
jgi:hypothetical protein